MKKTIYILFLIAMVVSCKTTKQATQTTSSETPATKEIKHLEQSVLQVQPDIRTANFNSLMVHIKVNGNEFSTRAAMKIITDSIIQLSAMPVLGIEAARLTLTPKSIVVINKMNNLYYQTDYDSLLVKNGIPVRFKDLQALLLNQLFMVGNSSTSVSELLPNFERTPSIDGTMLRSKPLNGLNTEFLVDASKLISYCSAVHSQGTLRCYYSNFALQNNILFPFKSKITLLKGGYDSFEGEIQINNAEFNKTIKINIADLSNYTRVNSLEELYK